MKRLQLTVLASLFVLYGLNGARADLVFNQGDGGSLTLTGIIDQVTVQDSTVNVSGTDRLQRKVIVRTTTPFQHYTGGFQPAGSEMFITEQDGNPFTGVTRMLIPFTIGFDQAFIPVDTSTQLSISHGKLGAPFPTATYDFAQLTFDGNGAFDPCCTDISVAMEINFLDGNMGNVLGSISGSVNAIPEPSSFAMLSIVVGAAASIQVVRCRVKTRVSANSEKQVTIRSKTLVFETAVN